MNRSSEGAQEPVGPGNGWEHGMERSKFERGESSGGSQMPPMSLEQIRTEALLWRLTGLPNEWTLELHRLEQALDGLTAHALESRLSTSRLDAWRRRLGERSRLNPDQRLEQLLHQVSLLVSLGAGSASEGALERHTSLPGRGVELWGLHGRHTEPPLSSSGSTSAPPTLTVTPVRRPDSPLDRTERQSLERPGPDRVAGERREPLPARGTDGRELPRLEPLPRASMRGAEPPQPHSEHPHFDPPSVIALELALDLLPWVLGREVEIHALLNRLRQNLFRETGVRVPVISLSDAGSLAPGSYRLELRGETVAVGRLRGLECLVLDAPAGHFEGTPGQEPAFGMPGLWIAPSLKELARSEGLTVLSPVDMFLAHVTEVLRTRIHEIYGASQLSHDLHWIESRLPGMMSQLRQQPGEGLMLRVFRLLLEEGLSIRDLDTIFEALLEHSRENLGAEVLTSRVRRAMRRHISGRFVDDDGLLHTFVLAGELESRLLEHQRDETPLQLPAEIRSRLLRAVQLQLERWNQPVPPVLVCPDLLRFTIRRTLLSLTRVLPVLGVGELATDVKIRHCGELNLMHAV